MNKKQKKKEPKKVPMIQIDSKQAAKSLASFRPYVKGISKQSHVVEQNGIVIPDAKRRDRLKTLLEDYVPTYRNMHDPLTVLHELVHRLFSHSNH